MPPSAQLILVPITKIDPPTANPRFAAEDLDELATSIREVGILEPLLAVVSGPDRVRLVADLTRFPPAVQRRMLGATIARKEAGRLYDATGERAQRTGSQRGRAETCLRSALAALKSKDRKLAVEMTERALEALRRADLKVVV